MRKRKLWIALAVLLVASAIVVVVLLRRRAAPEAARLLPDGDGIIYINLRVMRLAKVFDQAATVSRDPEYEDFVKQTGFQFERDLDEAAFAVHASGSAQNPARPGSQNAAFGELARFSEIFIGRLDSARAAAYFRKLASSVERYRDADIFIILHEGRTVRVAILGVNTVAVSNVQSPEILHQMIDHYHAAALALGGPSLLRAYYRHVPLESVAWAIGKFSPAEQGKKSIPVLGGLGIPAGSLAGSAIVASARYRGSIQLRLEAFTPGENNARQTVEQVNTLLALFRGAESTAQTGGPDRDVRAFLDSIKVEQNVDRVLLTATLPQGFVTKALSEPPATVTAPEPPAPAEKAKPAPRRGHKAKTN